MARLYFREGSGNWEAFMEDFLEAGYVMWGDVTTKLGASEVKEISALAKQHKVRQRIYGNKQGQPTVAELRAFCREYKFKVSGGKDVLLDRIRSWMETADLSLVSTAYEENDVAGYVAAFAYRNTLIGHIVELVGSGEVKVPIHNGYCTDSIVEITGPQRGEAGVWVRNADYCVRTWLHGKPRNVTAGKTYPVSLFWLLCNDDSLVSL